MTDMRGRHGVNFLGTFIDIEGDNDALNDLLDELEYFTKVEVLARRDTENGGVLALRLAKFERQKVIGLARKHGLVVAG